MERLIIVEGLFFACLGIYIFIFPLQYNCPIKQSFNPADLLILTYFTGQTDKWTNLIALHTHVLGT